MNKSPLVLTKNCPVLLSSVSKQQSVNLYSGYVPANKNNLISEASKIFTIITRLKTKTSDDLKKLQKILFHEIENFGDKVKLLGFDEDCAFACIYALNSCIEELFSIYSNVKKKRGSSAYKSFNIADRERFFIILDRICRDPKKFIDVIELIYVCFVLGFDSQLKSYDNIKLTMDCIYQIIRGERGEVEKKLSFLNAHKKSFKRKKTKSLFASVFKILFSSFIVMCGMYVGTYYLFKMYSLQIVNNLDYVQTERSSNLLKVSYENEVSA